MLQSQRLHFLFFQLCLTAHSPKVKVRIPPRHRGYRLKATGTLYEVQHILGHTQVKTTQRYAHLSHDTLLDATNSVNTALGGMFMPMVSAGPVGQVQLVQ